MTVQELIDQLTQRNPNVNIVIACEHDSAFEHKIAAIVNRDGHIAIIPMR